MHILIYIVVMLFLPVIQLLAHDKDTLSAFIDKNPNAVDFNVIYEGTKLNLSADDSDMLINISVGHPALQMRFLMQDFSIYIDPSGKKRKKYEIILPSAIDVKDELEAVLSPNAETTYENRPDIRPLISALNKRGAEIHYGKNLLTLGYQRFHVEISQDNGLLNYYVLIPKEILMNDRKLSDIWTIGIFSINDFANMPPPKHGASDMMPPPLGDDGQQDIQELMQSDIRLWVKFSIDDVNNANLK